MVSVATATLTEVVLKDRLASYVRLRGGFPIPLAGGVYWLVLGIAGYYFKLGNWASIAFIGSGVIFPLGLLLSKIFNAPFMKDRTSVSNVMWPAFIGMLLFWPMMLGAISVAPQLVPLMMGIGMSAHWPVIGWGYGRTILFSAHSIIRAVTCLMLWMYFPEHRLTWLPFSIAAIYFITVIAILIDVKNVAQRNAEGAGDTVRMPPPATIS
jgi:hypothetical protein